MFGINGLWSDLGQLFIFCKMNNQFIAIFNYQTENWILNFMQVYCNVLRKVHFCRLNENPKWLSSTKWLWSKNNRHANRTNVDHRKRNTLAKNDHANQNDAEHAAMNAEDMTNAITNASSLKNAGKLKIDNTKNRNR